MPAAQHRDARELLLAGIADTQGTIHANDAKCSAALITHGLIFAGLVTVSANVANVYLETSVALRVVAIVLAGLALVAFVVSVVCLLRAVMPYQPSRMRALIGAQSDRPPGVFYAELEGHDPLDRQLTAASTLDDEAIRRDLVAESVKLAEIREHEGKWATRGYWALIVELLIAAAYLSVVVAAALVAA